jgi:hypothetical protein
MRVLVCGSRTFTDAQFVWDVLRAYKAHGVSVVITGMAKGADTHAVNWANANHITLHEYPADWKTHGKKAGVLRNQQMLNDEPHVVLAFVDKPLEESKGTADMVRRAMRANVPTYVLQRVRVLSKGEETPDAR